MDIYVVVQVFGLNVSDLYAFVGRGAAAAAADKFQRITGISYAEYQERRQKGEENYQILDEDDEGTEIYIIQPTECNEG